MNKCIKQTLLSIEPEVSLEDFGKIQAFYVKVKCYFPFIQEPPTTKFCSEGLMRKFLQLLINFCL